MLFFTKTAREAAKFSELAYDAKIEISHWLDERDYQLCRFFDSSGTQAFIAESDNAVIVVFRGTEPDKLEDWMADVKVKKIKVGNYRVHRGFYESLQKVAQPMENLVRKIHARKSKSKFIYITGHSLGAALATQFAFFNIRDLNPYVYLFGCPRIGGWRFAKEYNFQLGKKTWRFVNHRDVVSRIPLWFWNYRHVGRLCYFTAGGKLLHEPGIKRRVIEFFRGYRLSSLSNHNVHEYVRLTNRHWRENETAHSMLHNPHN